jgi:anti-sigma B factor antagonist
MSPQRKRSYASAVAEDQVTAAHRDGDTITVFLRGEVDVLNVDQVRRALSEALAAQPRQIVVLSGLLEVVELTP